MLCVVCNVIIFVGGVGLFGLGQTEIVIAAVLLKQAWDFFLYESLCMSLCSTFSYLRCSVFYWSI